MKNLLIVFGIIFVFSATLAPKVFAESFAWPSSGYLGWRFYDNTNGQEGINGTYHTGIDIWSNSNGGWNSDGSSNPVYAVYPGQVVYKDYLGLQVKHRDGLYTNYWHIKSQQTSVGSTVNQNTLLGYQDFASAVHVHVTITSASIPSGFHDADGDLDPSSYFGMQLDVRKSNVVAKGTRVIHTGTSCGSANVVINYNVAGDINCWASSSITISPESDLIGNQRYYIN